MTHGEALWYLGRQLSDQAFVLGLLDIIPRHGEACVVSDPHGLMYATAYAAMRTGDPAFLNTVKPELREHLRNSHARLMSLVRATAPFPTEQEKFNVQQDP